VSAREPTVRYEFVPWGISLEPQAGRIAVDVGNKLLPGVIDHHQPDADHGCAASLIVREPSLVLDHLTRFPTDDLTVLMHIYPDLDCVIASYLVRALFRKGSLPTGAPYLAQIASAVDAATLPRELAVSVGLPSVYLASCALLARSRDWTTPGDLFDAQLRRGLDLLDHVLGRLLSDGDRYADAPLPLASADLFAGEHPFIAEVTLLFEDLGRYAQDLEHGTVARIAVLDRAEASIEEVDCLTVADPASILLKSIARADASHSPRGLGFEALHVIYRDRLDDGDRQVISVAPDRKLSLRGLGTALERAERARRADILWIREGPPRWPDVDNADPWYDGRNPLHRYTIVDSPGRGTVLDETEVGEILAQDPSDPLSWQQTVVQPRSWICPECGKEGPRRVPCDLHACPRIPSVVADYHILQRIGGGGMGEVFEVHDRIRHRVAAMKVLEPRRFGDPASVQRFEREARIASAVVHDNLVLTYDRGVDDHVGAWFVMERLQGRSLAHELVRWFAANPVTPYPANNTCYILARTCDGLAALHDQGIRHRDLKPSNVHIDVDRSSPVVKLLDFGVSAHPSLDPDAITETGAFCGTFLFMAPEVFGGRSGPSQDVYALGCLLYQMIHGYPPHSEEDGKALSSMQVIDRRRKAPPPREETARVVGEPLARLVHDALLPDPVKRVPDVRAFRSRLIAAYDPDTQRWRGAMQETTGEIE